MSFNSPKVIEAYKNLIGWEQFYNTEIVLPTSLTDTESGEYFQDFNSAIKLNVIQTLLPNDYPLEDYLRRVVTQSSTQMFNDLLQYRQLKEFGKTLLQESILLNRYGWGRDSITNNSKFVGFQIRVMSNTGLKAVINQVGLQFTEAETFDLYLFHSSQKDPLQVINVTTKGGNSWTWDNEANIDLKGFNGDEYNGGVFVLGYYQDDLTGNAINYSNFNWDKGECGTCNNAYSENWKNVNKYYHVYPLYVDSGNYVQGEMFDLNDADYINNQSYGLNLKLSVQCDFTEFFLENKYAFKNLLGIKVATRVMNDMIKSLEINSVEENLKHMIIRDMEGDKDTNAVNMLEKYKKELEAVSYNTSSINDNCMRCKQVKNAPVYGIV